MGKVMKLEMYYVVRKYFDNGSPLSTPLYESGPYKSSDEAHERLLGKHWLHNNCYAVVKQVVDVEEIL